MTQNYKRNREIVSVIFHCNLYDLVRILIIVGLLFLVFRISELLVSLLFAFIIMSTLKPLALSISNKLKIPKGVSMTMVVIFVISFLTVLLYFVSASFAGEFSKFAESLPNLSTNIVNWLSQIPYINRQEANQLVESITNGLADKLNVFTDAFGGVILGAFKGVTSFLFVIVFAIYLFIEMDKILDLIGKLFNIDKHEIFEIYHKVESQLGNWVIAQSLLCFSVGIATYIGLTLIGLRHAVPLAVLAGILEVVPIIGPIITGVIITLVGLSVSPVSGFLGLALSIVVQQLENNILVPLIMKKAVGISPVLSIIALLVGQEMFGLLGAIISIPMTAVITVLIDHYTAPKSQKNNKLANS